MTVTIEYQNGEKSVEVDSYTLIEYLEVADGYRVWSSEPHDFDNADFEMYANARITEVSA